MSRSGTKASIRKREQSDWKRQQSDYKRARDKRARRLVELNSPTVVEAMLSFSIGDVVFARSWLDNHEKENQDWDGLFLNATFE